MIFEEAIDTLLKQNIRITNRQVRTLTNLSKQTVATYLGRLVDNGQLVRSGRGRSLWYEPPSTDPDRLRFLPETDRFWAAVAARDPDLRYVRIATTCPSRTRRADADLLFSQYPSQRRLVLDFEGADDASIQFLVRLLFESYGGEDRLTINLSPTLKQKIALAGRLYMRAGEISVQ